MRATDPEPLEREPEWLTWTLDRLCAPRFRAPGLDAARAEAAFLLAAAECDYLLPPTLRRCGNGGVEMDWEHGPLRLFARTYGNGVLWARFAADKKWERFAGAARAEALRNRLRSLYPNLYPLADSEGLFP